VVGSEEPSGFGQGKRLRVVFDQESEGGEGAQEAVAERGVEGEGFGDGGGGPGGVTGGVEDSEGSRRRGGSGSASGRR